MGLRVSEDDVIAGLRVQVAWHQAREKRFEAEVKRLRAENDAIDRNWTLQENELQELRGEVERLRTDLETSEDACVSLRHGLYEAGNERLQLEAEVERLRAALELIALRDPLNLVPAADLIAIANRALAEEKGKPLTPMEVWEWEKP